MNKRNMACLVGAFIGVGLLVLLLMLILPVKHNTPEAVLTQFLTTMVTIEDARPYLTGDKAMFEAYATLETELKSSSVDRVAEVTPREATSALIRYAAEKAASSELANLKLDVREDSAETRNIYYSGDVVLKLQTGEELIVKIAGLARLEKITGEWKVKANKLTSFPFWSYIGE